MVGTAFRMVRGSFRRVRGSSRIVRRSSRIVRRSFRIVRWASRIVRRASRIVRGSFRRVRGSSRIVRRSSRIVWRSFRTVRRSSCIVRRSSRSVRSVHGAPTLVEGPPHVGRSSSAIWVFSLPMRPGGRMWCVGPSGPSGRKSRKKRVVAYVPSTGQGLTISSLGPMCRCQLLPRPPRSAFRCSAAVGEIATKILAHLRLPVAAEGLLPIRARAERTTSAAQPTAVTLAMRQPLSHSNSRCTARLADPRARC